MVSFLMFCLTSHSTSSWLCMRKEAGRVHGANGQTADSADSVSQCLGCGPGWMQDIQWLRVQTPEPRLGGQMPDRTFKCLSKNRRQANATLVASCLLPFQLAAGSSSIITIMAWAWHGMAWAWHDMAVHGPPLSGALGLFTILTVHTTSPPQRLRSGITQAAGQRQHV
ncbi:predicted protein [Plenodomus lingam JN3]|uniref:Predicted protein n=1 Tax=Leptosphaeria maculans (strain JN3 / isolate v23.1.3 / race Av1-4-5-6-7-8) TaxID=985895 RepID=E5AAT6_LEPMJ|nr:predicted protein [Plenodomus lingam JN3]CBY00777.1 predicted protein [Plenodomus lingam JN3]